MSTNFLPLPALNPRLLLEIELIVSTLYDPGAGAMVAIGGSFFEVLLANETCESYLKLTGIV